MIDAPLDALVLDAALRQWGGSVQQVRVYEVEEGEEPVIHAAVRLRPGTVWVNVTIIARSGDP